MSIAVLTCFDCLPAPQKGCLSDPISSSWRRNEIFAAQDNARVTGGVRLGNDRGGGGGGAIIFPSCSPRDARPKAAPWTTTDALGGGKRGWEMIAQGGGVQSFHHPASFSKNERGHTHTNPFSDPE